MKAKYVARKSLIGAVDLWKYLVGFLLVPGSCWGFLIYELQSNPDFPTLYTILLGIVPLFTIIWVCIEMIGAGTYIIKFYDSKIVVRSGIFTTTEQTYGYSQILSVEVYQPILGKIFNYGTVKVDVIGKFDIDTKAIKNPQKLKEFLEKDMETNRINLT